MAPGCCAGLDELGYIEGRECLNERRYGNFDADRFRRDAADLVALKVDVIVVISTSPATAAKDATDSIPIVVGAMADPVGDELVASLARPGGNITGTTFLGPELIGKRLSLLKVAMPGFARVAGLWHPTAYQTRTIDEMVRETEAAARTLNLQLQFVPAAGPDHIDDAFVRIAKEPPEAVIVLPSPMLFAAHKQIVTLASQHKLPAIYAAREFVDTGGLMSYGANLPELFRRAAYVEKILKGAKPADLPVEQPTKLEFLINLKTAKEQGLPRSRISIAGRRSD